ncbi:hypothetical protein VTI28DRAFT_4679 [Corynascus sepedonium]
MDSHVSPTPTARYGGLRIPPSRTSRRRDGCRAAAQQTSEQIGQLPDSAQSLNKYPATGKPQKAHVVS